MSLHLVTAPAVEPIDLDDAKAHARVDSSAATIEDQLIYGYIGAARRYGEDFTNRQFITATWELWLDKFPCSCQWIQIPLPPLQSVVSIKYLDTNGAEQTWASSNYTVDAPAGETCLPGRVMAAYSVVWPSTHPVMSAVKVRFQAGYGAGPVNIPSGIRTALLMHVADLYDNRQSNITGTISAPAPVTVDRLLWPYRVWPKAVAA